MIEFIKNKELYVFLILITLFQMIFQPLIMDEAYYYFFSQNLSLGYMDHPPMVAWGIALGTLFTKAEFAVRFINLFYFLGTFIILEKMIKGSGLWKFLFIFSFPVLHVLHLAIPDAPLIFGTTLFLYLIKKYLNEDHLKYAILLSITISFMLYSKYHGLLSLFFVVIATPYLLKRKSYYLILILTTSLCLPHLIWQIENDYPSVKYHLYERRSNEFKINNVTDFLAAFLPVISGLMFISFIFFKRVISNETKQIKESESERKFNKVLIWSFFGFIPFFLYFATKGPVEINWVFSASIPFIIWFGNKIDFKNRLVKITGIVSFVIFCTLRILLMTQSIPNVGLLYNYAGYEEWALKTKELAGDKKVVFSNNYQLASLYGYYNDEIPFSYNTLNYRINHYSMTNNDKFYNGNEVLLIGLWNSDQLPLDTVKVGKIILDRKIINDFYVFNYLWFYLIDFDEGSESYTFNFKIDNKGQYPFQKYWNDNLLKFNLGIMTDKEQFILTIENSNVKINNSMVSIKVNKSNLIQYFAKK